VPVLGDRGHAVRRLILRDMDIRDCAGCFDCWVKTPGHCHVDDGSQDVNRAVIRSDLVVFASPVIMGFTSAVLKKANDKLIPLLHPYVDIVEGELHHRKRYDSYPAWGLVLDRGEDADDEDVEIVREIYRRDAINFRTRMCFTHSTSDGHEEVADAIDRV